MKEIIQTLIVIIKKEEELLSEFLGHLEEQKKILLKNDVEHFEESVLHQEELIVKIKSLEQQRIEKVQSLAKGLSMKESELTLTRLVEMSLGTVSGELREVKKSITSLVERIRRVNQVNQYLIKRSMNRAQHNIDWLIDSSGLDVTYESNGQLRNRHLQSIMVNKTL